MTGSLRKLSVAAFAVMLAVSMFAPAVGAAMGTQADANAPTALGTAESGGAGGAPALGDASSGQPVQQADDADVTISDALENESGTTEVVVRLPQADTSEVAANDQAVSTLKQQAKASQRQVFSWAESTESVEVLNSFWIANAVLVEVDLDKVTLEEIGEATGAVALHENFKVTLPESVDDNSTSTPDNETSTSDNGTSTPDETTSAPEDGASENSTSDGASETDSTDVGTEENVLPAAMQPQDWDTTYGLDIVNATEVWDQYNTQGEGASVAVLDTGVDPDHPDLEIDSDNWGHWDWSGDPIDSEPHDDHYHGTHTSGTVIGSDAPAGDVPAYGVAPEATLYHGKVLAANGSGSFAKIIAGIEWATEENVDIISMSLGASSTSTYYPGLIEPVENARASGTLLVGAVGNQGLFQPPPPGYSGSPGNYWSSLGVGATDQANDVAYFSLGENIDTSEAWGSDAPDYWPEEYTTPAVSAPGVEVLSAEPGGTYQELNGTSMSTPHVAGVAALMVSAGGPDDDTLFDVLEDTAWKPADAPAPEGERDNRYGMGIVDAAEAVNEVYLESGVAGNVTDADGNPIEGATVANLDEDYQTQSNENGEYTLVSPPGNHTIEANAFGYAPETASVNIPDDETYVSQNFSLSPSVDAELLDGQPEQGLSGAPFNVTFQVANADTLTVTEMGDYGGDVTVEVMGSEYDTGESISLGGHTGELEVTVMTEADTSGSLSLEHTFEGMGDSVSLETGPTQMIAELTYVAVVDDVGTYGSDVQSALQDTLPNNYEVDVLTSSEAVNNVGNYSGFVVQSLNDANAGAFVNATETPTTGTVYMQTNFGPEALSARASVIDDPTGIGMSTGDATYEVVQNHSVFEGIAGPGDEITVHTDSFGDEAWFDDTDATVLADTTGQGHGFAVDDHRQDVLAATYGWSAFTSGAFTADALDLLGNSVEWSTETPRMTMVGEQGKWMPSGDMLESKFVVRDLQKIQVELNNSSTADQDELLLYVGENGSTGVNAWGEWRSYPEAMDSNEYMVQVESDEDTVGSVVLDITFEFENGDRETITSGPTAVYDKPLNVPGDVDSLQAAVDLVPNGSDIVVADGTYTETVDVYKSGLDIAAADGASPTVMAPADASGESVLDVTGDDNAIDGLSVDAGGDNDALTVSADDTEVTNVDAMNASTGIAVMDSDFANVSDVAATDVETGVSVDNSFGVNAMGVDVSDADTGVEAMDSIDVDLDGVDATNVSTGVNIDATETASVTNTSVSGAADTGIHVAGSSDIGVTMSTVMDAGTGIHVTSSNVNEITNNTVEDAEYGATLDDGASVSAMSQNDISNATYGLSVASTAGGEVALNTIDADTGVMASGSAGSLTLHFNDLEATETAIENTGSDGFDASLNWFGDGGPTANNGIVGDVHYDPFLTEMHDAVDVNTTDIATDLHMDANGTYTVGVPAASDQTVGDVFPTDFEGVVYGYDAETGEWSQLMADDELSALSALLVATGEDEANAVLHFQHDDPNVVPGSTQLERGWNLVSATEYANASEAFTENGHAPSEWVQAADHPTGDIGSQVEHDAAVNPFGGYWVFVPSEGDEYSLASSLQANPTEDDYYYQTGLLNESDDGGEVPSEVSVAVVDAQNYHEGAIETLLSDELGSGYSVDTLTSDELLDEMDGYDVFVAQRFGSDSLASDFLDQLGDDQGVVYLDSDQGGTEEAYADGIYRLNNVRSDPAERDSVTLDADSEPVEVDITVDHAIFDGVGSAGDSVDVVDSGTTWGAWFDDYSGTVLGTSDFSTSDDGDYEGPGVAVNEDANEVLNTAIAMDYFHDDPADYTEEGRTLFANSVEYAASLAFDATASVTPADESDGTEESEESEEDRQDDDRRTAALGASATVGLAA